MRGPMTHIIWMKGLTTSSFVWPVGDSRHIVDNAGGVQDVAFHFLAQDDLDFCVEVLDIQRITTDVHADLMRFPMGVNRLETAVVTVERSGVHRAHLCRPT